MCIVQTEVLPINYTRRSRFCFVVVMHHIFHSYQWICHRHRSNLMIVYILQKQHWKHRLTFNTNPQETKYKHNNAKHNEDAQISQGIYCTICNDVFVSNDIMRRRTMSSLFHILSNKGLSPVRPQNVHFLPIAIQTAYVIHTCTVKISNLF